jgi:single-stranded-DNA-specific exonuclease
MEILSTDDSFLAQTIAQKLEHHNAERKTLESIVQEQALEQAESINDDILIVSGEGWHPGVIGIVAGRIKEKYQKPVCVIAFEGDIGKASCRSIPGLDLGSLIQSAKQKGYLVAGGGHPMAAGFTIEKQMLQEFISYMVSKTQHIKPLIQESSTLVLEGNLSLTSINLDLLNKIKRVGPYGSGNPSPRFSVGPVEVSFVAPMGEDHLRCTLKQMDGSTLEAVSFRSQNTELGIGLLRSRGKQIYVAGTLNINTWMGRDKIQMTIDDGAEI